MESHQYLANMIMLISNYLIIYLNIDLTWNQFLCKLRQIHEGIEIHNETQVLDAMNFLCIVGTCVSIHCFKTLFKNDMKRFEGDKFQVTIYYKL